MHKEHHHRKLLPVTTTTSTRYKGQDQYQCNSERDAATTCNSNHHHWPAHDQHRCCWRAQCSNHCNLHKGRTWKEFKLCALTQVAMIATSCPPTTPVLIMSWSVVVVVGVACCCCILFRLALMLFLTFAPCTLTFAPSACGGCHWQQLKVVPFLPQPLAQRLQLDSRWFHPLQLALVVSFLPPTCTDIRLTLGQLALCGGGFLMVVYTRQICPTSEVDTFYTIQVYLWHNLWIYIIQCFR